MMTLNVCEKCGSNELRRSRVKTFAEWVFSLLASPYRCKLCDHRELKFNGIDMVPSSGHTTEERPAT